MQAVTELHQDHKELESCIQFYKQEISFLLKVLTPEYSKAVNTEKVKILDSYWKEFEKYYKKLESLVQEIRSHEYNLSQLYRDNLKQILSTRLSESGIVLEYVNISNALRAIKASFYDYLDNNHKKS